MKPKRKLAPFSIWHDTQRLSFEFGIFLTLKFRCSCLCGILVPSLAHMVHRLEERYKQVGGSFK